jgi:hypothetical protein
LFALDFLSFFYKENDAKKDTAAIQPLLSRLGPEYQKSLIHCLINLSKLVHNAFFRIYEKNVSEQLDRARILAIQDRNNIRFCCTQNHVTLSDLTTGCLEAVESDLKALDKFTSQLPGFDCANLNRPSDCFYSYFFGYNDKKTFFSIYIKTIFKMIFSLILSQTNLFNAFHDFLPK